MASFSSTQVVRGAAPATAQVHTQIQSRSRIQNCDARATCDASAVTQVLLGPSTAMSQLWARLQRVAPYFRTALLTGEQGAGQEAVARALHELSPLHARAFAVFPAAEAESRLAHEDARRAAVTLGTIYLPEPEALSRAAQTGLLALLRERGSTAPRLVSFAEHGLRPLVPSSGFSSELANSLGALPIEVPPLRERGDDLPLLAGHLLRRQAERLSLRAPAFAADFFDIASHLPWPGNLNQLQAALAWLLEHRSVSMLHGEDLKAALDALAHTPSATDVPPTRLVRLDQIIREQVQAVLMACNGNKLRAAEILGISRSTLYRMLSATGSNWTPDRR